MMIKGLFYFVIVIALAASCKGKKTGNAPAGENDSTISAIVADPFPAYRDFIAGLDTGDINSVSKASRKFTDLFKDSDTLKADEAYVLFHKLYNSVTSAANEQHLKDPTNYRDYVGVPFRKNIKRTPIKDAYLIKLRENGFSLAMSEGMTYVKQNRKFLSTVFYPHVSTEVKLFLEQTHKENEEGLISDAGLLVTPAQLADRIVWWDQFLERNPNFVFTEEIKQNKRGYTTFLLEGTDNTPLYNHGSGILADNYKSGFEHVLAKYPGSKLAGIVQPYFEAVKAKDKVTATKLLAQYRKEGLIYDYTA